MKKIISILLTVLMLVNMLAITAIPAAADTAVDLPANTAIVNLDAKEDDQTVVWQGTTYNVDYEVNYFVTIQDAINAAKDGDTILLCAGSYSEAVYISKSVNIKGAQAGVIPNLNEADGAESKKLNPARSLTDEAKETFNNGVWYPGYKTADTLADATTVTVNIDGVVFNNQGWIQSQIQNIDKDLYLTLDNCIANATANAFIYTNKSNTQYGDLYSRHITVKNTRFVNINGTHHGMFGKLIADEFLLDNVYVATTNTKQLTNEWLVSKSESNPKFVVKNSTFHINSQPVMIDVWVQPNPSTMGSLLQKESVTVEIDGNTFIGNATFAAIRPTISEDGLTNLKFKIKNNTFMNGSKPAVASNKASGSLPLGKLPSTCCEIDNNTFIDCTAPYINLGASYVTSAVTATRTLCIVDGAAVVPTGGTTVTFGSWYTNADKTRLAYTNAPIEFKGVQQSNDNKNLRFIVALDKLDDLKEIGIYLTADENASDTAIKSAKQSVSTVYTEILATGEHGIEAYTAGDLGGKYLMAVIVENVPSDVTFTVQPYAVYNDGVNVVTEAFDVVVADGVVNKETGVKSSEKAYRVDIPKADSLATYVGTTVIDNTLTFTYTGANADDVTAYAELLKSVGFVAGANSDEYVNSATDTKVVVTLDDGTLSISTASYL